FGIETDEAMQQRMYGRRNDEIVRDFFGPGLSVSEVMAHGAAKEALFREMIGPRLAERLVPGGTQFLQDCRGKPVGLASNAERPNIDFVIDGVLIGGVPLRSFFQVVVDGQKVTHPKPHPEIYLRVAGLLGTNPANCVVFEDSHTGVAAARAAGARVVGLQTTHQRFEDVDLAIGDFRSPELEEWLRSQRNRG